MTMRAPMSDVRPVRYVLSLRDTGLLRNRLLPVFLNGPVGIAASFLGREDDVQIGWGRKPSGRRACKRAAVRGQRFLLLEDGFLRSLHPGRRSPSCSLVVDDLGIYYDATQPSRLEALIARPLIASELARAHRLIHRWREAGVSKYNYAPMPAALPPQPYVLVVDQTANDASVQYGQADAKSFSRMLDEAIARYPDCCVVVKEHPEVKLGRKRGYLTSLLDSGGYTQVLRLRDDVHVVPLLKQATAVFTVTSQVGFEALLYGLPVHTFGMPFYAGWGLTEDALPPPSRRKPVPLEQLAFAALVRYTRYVLPHTGDRCEAEDAIEHVEMQRRLAMRFPATLHAVGFSRWKRPILRQFLQGHTLSFHSCLRTVPHGATVVRWGRAPLDAARNDVSVITVEDGFLRSVGLGAQLVKPVSWVFDGSGIYYDATAASDLETLLAETEFDADTLARAARLRSAIVEAGITKYNVGHGAWQRPASVAHVILVVGQVESDASLRFGAPNIRTNRALLERVREEAPDAYIVYKPHPDVMAGLRGSREDEVALRELCDELVDGYPMHQLIDAVDRVHVLTSLAGFEALLRGKPVTTHGLPFYAGWGLTDDRCHTRRRQRRLSLDMLVAGTLIAYPRYVLRSAERHASEAFATPEQAVAELDSWRAERPAFGYALLRRLLQPVLRGWAGKSPHVTEKRGARSGLSAGHASVQEAAETVVDTTQAQ